MVFTQDLTDCGIVAIAYLMQKYPYVFPIIGGRKVEHFQANLEALEISLGPEQITYLESIVPFEKGFPYSFFVSTFTAVCRGLGLTYVIRGTDPITTCCISRLDILTSGLVLRQSVHRLKNRSCLGFLVPTKQ
jgi:hypothetical protein